MSTRILLLRQRGFTLVEAIITIVLTGILAGVVVVFVTIPVKAYSDVERRSALSDAADTALRRIARDLRTAMPNSLRLTGTTQIEFIPIKSAGRYRAELDNGGGGNPLDFNSAADSFDVIGPGVDIAAGDYIVIYNLGISGADAYNGDNRRLATSAGNTLTTSGFNGGMFPFQSPAKRFQVVGTPVSFVCAGAAMTRYWDYTYGALPTTGSSAPIVDNVSDCAFVYQAGVTAMNGLVTLHLTLTREGESVSLIHQVHLSNAP
jgi:MSHA biogenesis protein MshO